MAKKSDNLIFGKHAVFEAVASGLVMQEIWITSKDSVSKLSASLKSCKVTVVSKSELDRISGGANHQGLVARAEPYSYCNLEDIVLGVDGKSDALIIVCDHITDVHNLGAILRSAESVGACGVVIENARSATITPTVYKTSAGAVNYVAVAKVANVNQSLDTLKVAGFWIVGASEHSKDELWESDLSGRIALVVGNEEKGIAKSVLANCDETFKLPQRGQISSLNVAQASTVFMYEWVRQNGKH